MIKAWFNTPRKCALWIIVILLVVIAYFLTLDSFTPNTDDATVNAYVIQVSSIDKGNITAVYVKNNQEVAAGQPLFAVDAQPYEIALAQAKADFAVAQNQFEQMNALYQDHAISKDVYLNYQKTYADAKQALDTANYNRVNVVVVAPSNGYITNLQVQKGSYVTAGATVMSFVKKDDWWVEADFKENDLAKIKPGQTVLISVNTQPGYIAQATVESIGWGVDTGEGGAGVLPTITKTENWVRLAQRFPVNINLTGTALVQLPLRVGTTAIVTVYTTKNPFLKGLGYFNHWIRAKAQHFY